MQWDSAIAIQARSELVASIDRMAAAYQAAAVTFSAQLADIRQMAIKALPLQLSTWRVSPTILENLRRYRRCGELRQMLIGVEPRQPKVLDEFLRNDLLLWRTKSDTQCALRESAEEALLTVEVGKLPVTDDPYHAIKKATLGGYRARMPSFLSRQAHGGQPQHAYWHGTRVSREIVAAVSLEQVCRRMTLSRIETAVLVARYNEQWNTWPEAERLFGLAPDSLEPLRKRLGYHRSWLAGVLGLSPLLSMSRRMKKN